MGAVALAHPHRGGTPARNSASTLEHEGKYIFCFPPCRWIFQCEPERYAGHKGLVKRVLAAFRRSRADGRRKRARPLVVPVYEHGGSCE